MSETLKLDSTTKTEVTKVGVLFKAAGAAPILKSKKWQVETTKTIAWVTHFLRKVLKLNTQESLFVYINQSFAPALDRKIGDLYDCFETNGSLVLSYALTPAWG